MKYKMLLIPFYPFSRGKQTLFWAFLFATYIASIIVSICPEPFGFKCSLTRIIWLSQFAMLMYTLECCRAVKAKQFMFPALLWAISLTFAVGTAASPGAGYMHLSRALLFFGACGLRLSLRHRLWEFELFNVTSVVAMVLLAMYFTSMLVWPGRILLGVILMFFAFMFWTISVNGITEINKRYLPENAYE